MSESILCCYKEVEYFKKKIGSFCSGSLRALHQNLLDSGEDVWRSGYTVLGSMDKNEEQRTGGIF